MGLTGAAYLAASCDARGQAQQSALHQSYAGLFAASGIPDIYRGSSLGIKILEDPKPKTYREELQAETDKWLE